MTLALRLLLACATYSTLLSTGCSSQGQPGQIRTPLPDTIRVHAPASDIPEPVSAFSGVWTGRWASHVGALASGSIPVDHTLVVERIRRRADDTYHATVIYSLGQGPTHGPLFYPTRGTISLDGVLRLEPTRDGQAPLYRLSSNRKTLSSEVHGTLGQPFTASGLLWRTTVPDSSR